MAAAVRPRAPLPLLLPGLRHGQEGGSPAASAAPTRPSSAGWGWVRSGSPDRQAQGRKPLRFWEAASWKRAHGGSAAWGRSGARSCGCMSPRSHRWKLAHSTGRRGWGWGWDRALGPPPGPSLRLRPCGLASGVGPGQRSFPARSLAEPVG